jgi:mannose-1-phosphate guanylyltransferase
MLHATIMAGGSGTRFWPASRKQFPKQFLNFTGDSSMLQNTVDRLVELCPLDQITIVTNAALVDTVDSQLANRPGVQVIGEPAKRDTAPCIALAASLALARDPQATMLIMPSDHLIANRGLFTAAIRAAVAALDRDPNQLITFGIPPTYPAEVFGYIERDETPLAGHEFPTYAVKRFREKPDKATAEMFLKTGKFYWNAGIFVWRAATILQALRQLEPAIMAVIDRIAASINTDQFAATLNAEFPKIVGKSIDYAVMEKYPNVRVIAAPFDWDDVGSWTSVERLRTPDSDGNAVDAERFLGIKAKSCIIRGHEQKLLVAIGVSDLIIVQTADATLIADKRDEASVKQVVEELEKRGWHDLL